MGRGVLAPIPVRTVVSSVESSIDPLSEIYLPLLPLLFLQREHEVDDLPFKVGQVTEIEGFWHGFGQQ